MASNISLRDGEGQRLSIPAFLDQILPVLFKLYEDNKITVYGFKHIVTKFYESTYDSYGINEYRTRWDRRHIKYTLKTVTTLEDDLNDFIRKIPEHNARKIEVHRTDQDALETICEALNLFLQLPPPKTDSLEKVRDDIGLLKTTLATLEEDMEVANEWYPLYQSLKKKHYTVQRENAELVTKNSKIASLEKEISRLSAVPHDEEIATKNRELAKQNEELWTRVSNLSSTLKDCERKLKVEQERWRLVPKFVSGSRVHMDELLTDLNEVSVMH
jgi:chromosome segregation ATPase